MANAGARPEKQSYLLVEFRHGDGASQREKYTDWQQDVTGFVSTPNMDVRVPENTGTFEDRECRIILPSDTFADRAGNGLRHSPIFVRVREVTEGLALGDVNTERTLFRGRVMRVIKNFQGASTRVAFFCLSAKASSRLKNVKMGLPCNHHCVWTLFGAGCQLNQASFEANADIDSVDGKEITVTDTNVQSLTRQWRRGYIEYEGLRIPISDWSSSDPTKFYTARRVPDDWIGTSGNAIKFVPGCNKTIEECRTTYNNEQHFGGFGFAIPAYQPNIEGK